MTDNTSHLRAIQSDLLAASIYLKLIQRTRCPSLFTNHREHAALALESLKAAQENIALLPND